MTNTIELQQWINETHAAATAAGEQWWQQPGMLGENVLLSFAGFLVVFHLVGLGIATYHQCKTYGRPKPGLWVKEIFRGGSIWGEAVIGKPTPRAKVYAGDSAVQLVSLGILNVAVQRVRVQMTGMGWTLEAYRHRALDCEDYCFLFKALLAYELVSHGTPGKGAPIHIIGYTRDSDGVGHTVIAVDTTTDGRVYFEAFPHKIGARKPLTAAEMTSIDWDIQ